MNGGALRRSPIPAVGIVTSVLLVLSLSLPWGLVHIDFSKSLLAGLEGILKDDTYSAWRMHKTWDNVIAAAAIVAITVNLRLLLGRRDHLAVSAAVSILAGAVSAFAVILTMIDPPVPPSVNFINGIGGNLLPKVELHPRYGLFVSLGLAVALIGVGIAQLLLRKRPAATAR